MPNSPAQAPTPRHEVALTFTPAELLDALRRAGYAFPPATQLRGVFERRELDQVVLVLRAADYGPVAPGSEVRRYPAAAVLAGEIPQAIDAAARAGGLFTHATWDGPEHAARMADARATAQFGEPAPLPGQSLRTIDRLRTADRQAGASAALGDAGIGVGMAVST